ncbi:hypothetical protein [Sphingomonas sp.]|uniref:hypothetical protein n=1 Tax=Sphingomonas sp. TaxID=28214 RepID=UPI0025CDE829|nr:hypothetical protein [Sphingomonas sp.]
MTEERERFEVRSNKAMNDWFIVHHHRNGSVWRRDILADHFESEDAANRAADEMNGKLGL